MTARIDRTISQAVNVVTEQLDADHLAGAGIDGCAHQCQFAERHALAAGKRAEQGAERRRGERDQRAAAQAFQKVPRGSSLSSFLSRRLSSKAHGLAAAIQIH